MSARRRSRAGGSASPDGRANGRWSLPRKQVLRFVRQDESEQQYFIYVPGCGGDGAPLLVAVHGILRNGYEQALLFSGYCEKFGVVLVAPRFTEEQFDDYQRLGRARRGFRADTALDSILEEATWLTGAVIDRIYLFGYSGGAQFAHRYAMAHPRRVARAAIASAGWYTFPDARKRFPYGIRSCRDLPDVRFDPEQFLRVPIRVFVGDQDTTSERLRNTPRVNEQQGRTRIERARNWAQAMRDAARARRLDPLVSFESIPGGDHSFANLMQTGRLGDRVFAALFGTRPAHDALRRHE